MEGNAELPRRAGSVDTAPRASGGRTAEPAELPPVASLRFDSDFTAFLKPDVDETLKRAALKQLFRDPRFNVMDGLDTYIDDYTQPDPIPSGMLSDIMDRFSRLTQPAEPGRPSQGDEASGPFVSSDSTASGAEGSQSTAGSGDASTAPLTTSEPGNEIPCSAGCNTPSPATEEGTGERAAVAPPERSS